MSSYPEFTHILNQQLLAQERTATWLAHRLGLHPGTVNRWLNQDSRPATPELVARIVDLLRIHQAKERQTFILAAGYGYLEGAGATPTAPTANETPASPAFQAMLPSHNLPPQPTTFVGREQELAQLAAQIALPDLRLLTIVGFGGIGKTRLALEMAARQLDKFADGVWFVSLVGVETSANNTQLNPLVMGLANALSVVFLGQGDPEAHLLSYLHKMAMLLLFDNVEHLLGHSDFLSRRVLKTERIKVIVTSRERLQLREEWLFPLAGLAMPALDGMPTPEQTQVLTHYDAARLFAQQARRVHPTFDLSAEIKQVLRICHLVEGIPLGIELAAAWLRQMPLSMIATEIESSLDFLISPLRNQPERHRSFRTVFEHSWKLLANEEQEVLMSLSVFRHGFRRPEAKAVTDTSLQTLTSLVDKSFLRLNEGGRYAIHERIRQYAAEKLRQVPNHEKLVRERHGRTYLAFLGDQGKRLMTADQQMVLTALTDDLNNIHTAWVWALEQGKLSEILLATPNERSQTDFMHFYFLKSWLWEGLELAIRTVAGLRVACGSAATVLTNYQNQLALGVHLVYVGQFQAWIGLLDQAKLSFQEGQSLLHQLDPKPLWELASAENTVISCLHRNLDSRIAVTRLETNLALFSQLGDKVAQGIVLTLLGQAAFSLGNYAQAQHFCRSSLRYVEAPFQFGYVLMTLGRIAQEKGKYQQAEAHYQEALHHWTQINYQQGLCFIYKDLGHIARLRQAYHKAQPYLEQSVELAQRISFRVAEVEAIHGLAQIAEDTGNDGTAEQYFQRILVLDQQATSRSASALNGLGRIALKTGEQQAAIAYFSQSLQISHQAQTAPQILEAAAGIAYYFAQTGRLPRAIDLLDWVQNHPATGHETKQWATNLLSELVLEAAPEVVVTAQKHSQSMQLDIVAVELRRELAPPDNS